MPRKLRRPKPRIAELSPAMRGYLLTGEYGSDDDGANAAGWFDLFQKTGNHQGGLRADWLVARDVLLAGWIHEHPGTRPWGWWRFDAPRWRHADQPARVQPITALDCAEPRRRLGGVGTPDFEALNSWPSLDRGVPTLWVTPFQEAYYSGRARDVDGKPIGKDYHDGHFAGVAPRADDPPTFESEAAYLERHGLLTAAERRRLPAGAFDPEVLAIDADDEIDPRAEFPDALDGPIFDERRPPDGGGKADDDDAA